MTFFAWLAAGACLLGLPGRYHSRGAFIALLVVALGASSGLIFALAFASTMPRGPNEFPAGDLDSIFHVLAVTDNEVLVQSLSDGLMRIRLDDMSVDRFPVEDGVGRSHQTVAHDDYFAFTASRSINERRDYQHYLALLGPDGFVIAPGEFRAHTYHYFSVTLSPEGDGFVLVDTAPEARVATISALARDGSLSEREVLATCDWVLPESACFSGGDLYLVDYLVAHRGCERSDFAICPGAHAHHQISEVIGPQGIQPRPEPANGNIITNVYTVFNDDGPTVVSDWFTDDLRREIDFGGGVSLRTAWVDEAEASQFGFVDDAAHFTRLRDGTPDAEAFVARWTFTGVNVLPSGDSLVIIDDSMQHYVRLDATTLERLDPPGVVESVRTRLAVWGGASWAFELLLTLALASMVLTWSLLAFLRGKRFTRQRALSLASAVLVLAAVLTFKRLFTL